MKWGHKRPHLTTNTTIAFEPESGGVGKNDILYEILETISVDPCAYLSKWSRYAHEVGTLKNKTKKTKPIRLREKTKY